MTKLEKSAACVDAASTETMTLAETFMIVTALAASLLSYILVAQAFLDLSTLG